MSRKNQAGRSWLSLAEALSMRAFGVEIVAEQWARAAELSIAVSRLRAARARLRESQRSSHLASEGEEQPAPDTIWEGLRGPGAHEAIEVFEASQKFHAALAAARVIRDATKGLSTERQYKALERAISELTEQWMKGLELLGKRAIAAEAWEAIPARWHWNFPDAVADFTTDQLVGSSTPSPQDEAESALLVPVWHDVRLTDQGAQRFAKSPRPKSAAPTAPLTDEQLVELMLGHYARGEKVERVWEVANEAGWKRRKIEEVWRSIDRARLKNAREQLTREFTRKPLT